MISRGKVQLVRSLAEKKHRRETGLFVAEGVKIVDELLASRIEVVEVFGLSDWIAARTLPASAVVHEVTSAELGKISELTTPNQVVALARMPRPTFDADAVAGSLVVGLEDVSDPGNLGSILRLCDWFGVETVIASRSTVDCFNPKVVQSSMGSIARVVVHYRDDLPATLAALAERGQEIVGTTLDGEDIHRARLDANSVVVFGRESHGLSGAVGSQCRRRLRIPAFGPSTDRAESLNVAAAVAIVCNEYRRFGR